MLLEGKTTLEFRGRQITAPTVAEYLEGLSERREEAAPGSLLKEPKDLCLCGDPRSAHDDVCANKGFTLAERCGCTSTGRSPDPHCSRCAGVGLVARGDDVNEDWKRT